MTNLEDDSLFVVKLTLILCGLIIFCYSKAGTYFWWLTGAMIWFYYMGPADHFHFVNQFIFSIIFISVIFELIFPIIFHYNESEYLGAKREFSEAREELKQRKNSININDKL